MEATALLQSTEPGKEEFLIASACIVRCSNGHANVGIDMSTAIPDPLSDK
jgi:hypothetical protein